MEASLKKLLVDAGCEPPLLAVLEKAKCLKLDIFAHWVRKDAAGQDKDDISEVLLAGTTFEKDVPACAMVRSAYAKAKIESERRNKRTSEGLTPEAMDSTLDEEVQEELTSSYLRLYNLKGLNLYLIGSDNLLALIHREFKKLCPSIFEFSQIKTCAESQKRNNTRTSRLLDRFSIVFDEGPLLQADGVITDLITFLHQFRLAVNTWSLAGCFQHEWTNEAGAAKTELFVHRSEAKKYMWAFESLIAELRLRYSDASICRYLQKVELAFRQKAIELTRGPSKVPFGKALLQSLDLNATIWSHYQYILQDRFFRNGKDGNKGDGRGGGGRSSEGSGGKQGGVKKELGDNNGGGGTKRPLDGTAKRGEPQKCRKQVLDGGVKLCRNFNEKNGCTSRDCRWTHACDVQLAAGGVCQKKDHNALKHSNEKHGQAKLSY